jgi:enoyl-CoA hydratase
VEDVMERYGTVEYEVREHVARITMDRPEKRNALDDVLIDGLDAAFAAAEHDPDVHAVVLAGNGPSFCSGYDLGGSRYATAPEGGWDLGNAVATLRGIEGFYQRVWNCPKPTIARVQGHALAGGCYLQLLCDISVAATDARLGHPAVKMGGPSSMPLWQVALPLKVARYLLLTGRIVDGTTAASIGLVSLAVEPGELDATVDELAAEVAAVPPHPQQLNKEALNTALDIMGVGAMFRYHGQMNALRRLG